MYEKIYHIITDINGNYTYINPHFKEKFGFLHDNFIGNQSIKSIHEEDANLAIEATQRLFSGKSTVEYLKLRKPNPDGSFFWTYWEFKINYNDNNLPNGINCIGYDIAKVRKAEIENIDVRQLINHSNVIADLSTFCLDIASDSIQLSDEFYTIFNLEKKDNITLEHIFKKIHPEDLPKVNRNIITELKTTKTITAKQFRILDPTFENGIKYIEGIYEYRYNLFSEKEFIYGIIIDITKLKKKEAELASIIEHLKSFLDKSDIVICVINKEYKMVSFNQESVRVVELFGITPYVGQYVLELIPDDYKQRIVGFYERAFLGETIHLDFYIYYTTSQWLSDISYYPIKNDKNQVEFVFINCKFNDLNILQQTEKIKIAKSIIDFQENEKNRIATELHDSVNQLLYIAKINLTQIEDSKSKTKVTEILDLASNEIKSIINNSSHFLLENTSFSDSVNQYLSTIFKDSQIKHNVEIQDKTNTDLQYDLKLNIFRIIQEISQNVSKHSSASVYRVKIKIYKTELCFFTSDNGKGFEYSQISTGMGLDNIKNRVAFLNGKIKIITKYNNGTLFGISIPIQ